MRLLQTVPPAPEVMCYLVNEYHARWKPRGITFGQFLQVNGYANPRHAMQGMDDALRGVVGEDETILMTMPHQPMTGCLHVMVLLVDFPDLEGVLSREYYEELLFSHHTYLTGSMADYYEEVSRGKITITGEVHGWLRMPRPYRCYTNGRSGLIDACGREHYPRDARKLAEDAVEAALAYGVKFPARLDAFSDGTVSALCIVHAGLGAERLHPLLRGHHIWSHKWTLQHPKWVATNLWVTTYLMVPQEALLGVCAHELGHLVFQWPDVYEPHYDDRGEVWDGNGMWDLMASGAYTSGALRPVHPAGLHKLQHGWIAAQDVRVSQRSVVLQPVTQAAGMVVKVWNPRGEKPQYLLLENRAREAFDRALPGEGLLVWCLDASTAQTCAKPPHVRLIPANGRHRLRDPDERQNADPGDPFPGTNRIDHLSDNGQSSAWFADAPASGISLRNIVHDSISKEIRLDIEIATH